MIGLTLPGGWQPGGPASDQQLRRKIRQARAELRRRGLEVEDIIAMDGEQRPCSVAGCLLPARRDGLCFRHLRERNRLGSRPVTIQNGRIKELKGSAMTQTSDTCAVPGCANEAHTRGICGSHYIYRNEQNERGELVRRHMLPPKTRRRSKFSTAAAPRQGNRRKQTKPRTQEKAIFDLVTDLALELDLDVLRCDGQLLLSRQDSSKMVLVKPDGSIKQAKIVTTE
jgi:hypothetical protein